MGMSATTLFRIVLEIPSGQQVNKNKQKVNIEKKK